jgi:hypothetical protein
VVLPTILHCYCIDQVLPSIVTQLGIDVLCVLLHRYLAETILVVRCGAYVHGPTYVQTTLCNCAMHVGQCCFVVLTLLWIHCTWTVQHKVLPLLTSSVDNVTLTFVSAVNRTETTRFRARGPALHQRPHAIFNIVNRCKH